MSHDMSHDMSHVHFRDLKQQISLTQNDLLYKNGYFYLESV